MFKKFGLAAGLILISLSAFAQVFPDTEFLDTLHLSDGTILKGRIITHEINQLVEIEIYGGSSFVIAYENIERIEKVPNPDYNTKWIRIDIGAPPAEAPEPVPEPEPEPLPVMQRLPFLGQGHVYGFYAGYGMFDYWGGDWDTFLEEKNTDSLDEQDVLTLGLTYTYLHQARPVVAPALLWGVRMELAASMLAYVFESSPDALGGDIEYTYDEFLLKVPIELLIGAGGGRVVIYGGLGGGLSLLLNDPVLEDDGDGGIDPFDGYGHPSERDPERLQFFLRVSAGTYVRLSDRWNLDLRAFYDRQLGSGRYPGFSQYYQAASVGLGFGYHVR